MNRKVINSHKAPEPIGPYSQAIFVNGVLYVSGQIAIDRETGNMANEDIATEAHQVMRNLEYILHEAGMAFKNVAKCSIFLKDVNDFQVVNNVYGQYFSHHHPARETVEVSRLPKGAKVEISCIAVKDEA
ncbi:MAG: RidA family protein [Thermoflexibacter sp.]|jgi:2-iminobutanoate/2-iminopropanoate deaminase|nr:RidA family protein [Thermoflexibacter sp.]